MKKIQKVILLSLALLTLGNSYGQQINSPCSIHSILDRMEARLPESRLELENQMEKTEQFIQDFIRDHSNVKTDSEFVIPVVMHVFHNGDDGKMGMEQALSGLEVLNNDFNGLNDGWDSIDPDFDTIKSTIDIRFCLAKLDPEGNSTDGLIYHEDPLAMLNQGNLFQHAWDNSQYLNIYFPKYTEGGPSNFTGYAYFPNQSNTLSNEDGIFYSSIRWGYGEHSELEEGQDWASVCSHEAGHWLHLFHPFEYGCDPDLLGDRVEDTPITLGSGIELDGCNNNDFSCGVHTNGENFMDYNHDCKKMFTGGQVERMIAALSHPSRINLWTSNNIELTGCSESFSAITAVNEFTEASELSANIYPNPTTSTIHVSAANKIETVRVFDLSGKPLHYVSNNAATIDIDLSAFTSGIYLVQLSTEKGSEIKKVILSR